MHRDNRIEPVPNAAGESSIRVIRGLGYAASKILNSLLDRFDEFAPVHAGASMERPVPDTSEFQDEAADTLG